jgi:hypothetical protein
LERLTRSPGVPRSTTSISLSRSRKVPTVAPEIAPPIARDTWADVSPIARALSWSISIWIAGLRSPQSACVSSVCGFSRMTCGDLLADRLSTAVSGPITRNCTG